MNTSVNRHERVVKMLRWVARIASILLFALWGAFFIEHISWFLSQPKPPLFVWLLQVLHLLLLLGFIIALRWEVAGSLLIVSSALVFFAQTAGANFLLFFALTIIPAALFLLCWWQERTPSPPNLNERTI
jgi:hypothetical protein